MHENNIKINIKPPSMNIISPVRDIPKDVVTSIKNWEINKALTTQEILALIHEGNMALTV